MALNNVVRILAGKYVKKQQISRQETMQENNKKVIPDYMQKVARNNATKCTRKVARNQERKHTKLLWMQAREGAKKELREKIHKKKAKMQQGTTQKGTEEKSKKLGSKYARKVCKQTGIKCAIKLARE